MIIARGQGAKGALPCPRDRAVYVRVYVSGQTSKIAIVYVSISRSLKSSCQLSKVYERFEVKSPLSNVYKSSAVDVQECQTSRTLVFL